MVQWVYENAKRCKLISEIVVATDHEQIAAVIEGIGGKVVMTDPDIPTGSDRVAVIAKLYPEMEVVINLQGDEPFVTPTMLEKLVEPYLLGEKPVMTTLAYPLRPGEENDPGIVKVITDLSGHAIYFSRSPIPYYREKVQVPVYHHIGLYAFQRDFLLTYKDLPQTPLQKAEALEQLRAIEHGYRIRVCLTEETSLEINTPEEYEAAQSF